MATTYYQPWEALLGFALGSQVSKTDTSSTCYGQVSDTYKFIDKVASNAYDIVYNFDITSVSSNFQTLAQNFNNLVIQLSDQNIACQENVKVKQLAVRTSKASGFFNWVFTMVYGLTFDDYLKPVLIDYASFLPLPSTNQNLLEGFSELKTQLNTGAPYDCHKLGYAWGLVVSEALEAKVESFVQFIEVKSFA